MNYVELKWLRKERLGAILPPRTLHTERHLEKAGRTR